MPTPEMEPDSAVPDTGSIQLAAQQLIPEVDRRWLKSFFTMIVASVVIATLGLSLNSAAVIIGAMLVAPMMMPVLGMSGALVAGQMRSVAVMLALVVGAAVAGICVAWTVTEILPSELPALTAQSLARTHPDIRDLGIALAAGVAGAYIKLHTRWTDSVAGVAVAVALVPPLAVLGMAMSVERWDLAGGALLLFVTNWVAITIAAVVVAVASGAWKKADSRITYRRRWWTITTVVAALLLLAVPLSQTLNQLVTQRQQAARIKTAVDEWARGAGLTLVGFDIEPKALLIDVAGDAPLPDLPSLTEQIAQIQPTPLAITIRRAAESTARGPKPKTSPDRVAVDQKTITRLANTWFSEHQAADVTSVEIAGHDITLTATGAGQSPNVKELASYLGDATGATITLGLNWTELEQTAANPDLAAVRQTADSWAAKIPGLDVIGVHLTPAALTIDLASGEPPTAQQTTELIAAVRAATGDPATPVVLRFAQLSVL